ncbi:MAG: hypothetical protein ACE5GL_09205 [Calditrichia bacterium]
MFRPDFRTYFFLATLDQNKDILHHFWKIHIDTAAYAIVEYHLERGFTLILLNETDHLQDFVREDIA